MRYGYAQLPRSVLAIVGRKFTPPFLSQLPTLTDYCKVRCQKCRLYECGCNWTEFPESWTRDYGGEPRGPVECNICGETAPCTWSSSEFGPCTFQWCLKCWKTGHPNEAYRLRGKR